MAAAIKQNAVTQRSVLFFISPPKRVSCKAFFRECRWPRSQVDFVKLMEIILLSTF
jgi:hypothetical protein